jgi:hypothetical protein
MKAWFAEMKFELKKLKEKYGSGGEVVQAVPPGSENDLMANPYNTKATFLQSDIDDFVARAGVRMKAKAGDILLDKDPTDQNLGVGADLEMFAPRGQTVHRDGLFAYCMDLHESVPDEDDGLDVLTSSSASGLMNFGALQAVLREIGRRQAGAGAAGPPGALDAVWAVTDAVQPFGEAAEILEAAGVTYDETLFQQTAHPEDPNTGSAKTAAVTTSTVLPAIPADASAPPARLRTTALPGPELLYAALAKRQVKAGKRRKVELRTLITGSDAFATATLVRKKAGKSAAKGKAPIELVLPAGAEFTTLRLRVKRPGRYKLVIDGDVSKTLKLKVKKKRRRR